MHVYVCRGVCVQCVGSYGTYQICRVNVRCVCMCVCMCVCGGKAEASVRDVCCHDNTPYLVYILPLSGPVAHHAQFDGIILPSVEEVKAETSWE